MISLQEVERQLRQIKANYRFWGRPEILELPRILVPGEQIQACVNGHYSGGFATFCATDQRLLLIDKKLLYLTVEDLRYDMINEVDYCAQLVTSTMSVCTPTKTMTLTTMQPAKLRLVATYIQQRVMEIRQEFGLHNQSAALRPASLPSALPEPPQTVQPLSASQHQVPQPTAEQPQTEDPKFELPTPLRQNPYMGAPLMMRHRIGRFGTIGLQSQILK